MENAKINKDAAAEPKNETPIVSDKETRARLYEEDEAQARETLSKAEALFALADEMFRQTFEDLKRSRPQAEMANDPNSLLPHLLCMKVSFDSVDEILDANRRVLQSQTDLAEKFSVWAAAEIDPDTKRHFLEMADRVRARVATAREKLQELESRKQLHSKELASLLADINESIATPVAKPRNEKD